MVPKQIIKFVDVVISLLTAGIPAHKVRSFLTAATVGLLPNCPIEVLRVKDHFYGVSF